jgi:hypothetical protein
VREGNKSAANNVWYMPVGGMPGMSEGNDDKDKEAKVLTMQMMEKSYRNMAVDINMDLSGTRPPLRRTGSSRGRACGSFMGLPKEEGQWQQEEQSRISGDDIRRKDPKENQGWAVHFHQ